MKNNKSSSLRAERSNLIERGIATAIAWLRNDVVIILFVLLLSIPVIYPLFSSGFFPIHDDTQVARVYEMKNALADGIFPVRWSENLGYGYGYPIFNFYAPLAYYVGGFVNLIGFNALVATKIMISIGMLLASVGMYLFASALWGRVGGVISALLYMYAPYHALNLYVRGAISELWAYGLLPFAFLGIYKIYRHCESANWRRSNPQLKQKTKEIATPFGMHQTVRPFGFAMTSNVWFWVSFTAVSYAGIILSHNLTAMMVSPFLFTFALILSGVLFFERSASWRSGEKSIGSRLCQVPFGTWLRPNSNMLYLFVSLLLGILLSAFYWLPALFEMRYTNVLSVVGGGSDYPDHFVCLMQLWNSPWGFAGSAPGCIDGVSFKLGKLHILFALLALIPLFFRRVHRYQKAAIILSFFGALVALFLLLDISKVVWDALPQMAFFQFPWRFLLLANFFTAFVGGSLVLLVLGRLQMVIGAIAVFLIIFVNAEVFVPSEKTAVSAEELTSRSTITWTVSKLSDEYMPQGFSKPTTVEEIPGEKIILTENHAELNIIDTKTQYIQAMIDTPRSTTALLNIAYFPAWQIYIDGEKVGYTRYDRGLKVRIPEGSHTLEAVYAQTQIEVIGNVMSLTGVILIIAGIIKKCKRYLNYQSFFPFGMKKKI